MHRRRLPRILFLLAVATTASALSAPQASAALPTTSFQAPSWWQCPDTGSCSAPVVRLWLPTFGRGYTKVESGRILGGCGTGCYEIANGELITIRAVPDPGYRFTGWGGKCQSIGRVTGCYFHMWNNYTAGATFEPDPAAQNLPPGTSRDPVTPVLDFILQLTGKGTVTVEGTGVAFPTYVCKTTYPCRVTRFIKRDVRLVAVGTSGLPFRGWGGRCRGTQPVCTFKNDFGRDGAPRVTAYFG
jgi:Divergent InlB B-repeat domain